MNFFKAQAVAKQKDYQSSSITRAGLADTHHPGKLFVSIAHGQCNHPMLCLLMPSSIVLIGYQIPILQLLYLALYVW